MFTVSRRLAIASLVSLFVTSTLYFSRAVDPDAELISASDAFHAAKQAQLDVVTLPSGLQYKVLTRGRSTTKPEQRYAPFTGSAVEP